MVLTDTEALRGRVHELEQQNKHLRSLLQPMAKIALRRDVYPDGPDLLDQSPELHIGPDEIRAARDVLLRSK